MSRDVRAEVSDYCRQIETYLCQKNAGHLIRIVGPSFELVSGWAERGVPFKVACRGIDRYVERYYRKGPRRRPVRVDFCEADVLDVFDEWRRATGMASLASADRSESPSPSRKTSLPQHLERIVRRLTNARATGGLDEWADPLIDRVSSELDAARSSPRGLRGEAREAVVKRLAAADAELLSLVSNNLESGVLRALEADAADQLSGFRQQMSEEAYTNARARTLELLLRERLNLPTIALDE